MGIWLYAYFIPQDGETLRIVEPLHHFQGMGFAPRSNAMEIRVVDGEGHCEAFGDRISLGDKPMERAEELLTAGRDLLVTFGGKDLWLTYASALQAANPHISVGWPMRRFDSLEDRVQWSYLTLFQKFARESRAAAVVIVEEPPGYFEDRFLYSDKVLLIDATYPGRYDIGIREIWLEEGSELSIKGLKTISIEPDSMIGCYQRYTYKFINE